MSVTDSGQDAAPAEEAAPISAPLPMRKPRRFWPALALLIACIAVGAIAWPVVSRHLPGFWRGSETQDIEARINALEKRLGAIESRENAGRSAGSLSERLDALEKRAVEDATGRESLSTLAARLDALQLIVPADLPQRLESFALKSGQDSLQTRLKTLEEQSTGAALHRAAAALALAELARAARDSKPFTEELAALNAVSPGDSLVVALKPFAEGGVRSLQALTDDFPDAARQALSAERAANAQGFFARLWSNIESAIAIRRVGNAQGEGTEARLARAQILLAGGNLRAALVETSGIKGVASESLDAWRRQAQARQALDTALVAVTAKIVRALADAGARMP